MTTGNSEPAEGLEALDELFATAKAATSTAGRERDDSLVGRVGRLFIQQRRMLLNTILTLSERADPLAGWRPVETHDGTATPVLVCAGEVVGEAYFLTDEDGGGWWWANTGPNDYDPVPLAETDGAVTHWRPLPPPCPATRPAND